MHVIRPRFFRFWKIHHQKGNRCRYDCSNGGNEDNLVIDILHDLIGFGPDGSGKNRLCVSAEDCDSQKCSIQASAIIDMPFCVRRSVFQFVFHVKVPPFYKSGRRITSPAFAYGFPASRKDAARSMQAAS